MTDKKLINSVEHCVDECLYGFSKLHPNLQLHQPQKILFDANSCDKRKVATISGGGSGHEPFPAGYVGSGMLTASVSGMIFASPPSNHILQAIRLAAAESQGVFLIIPNYTGDVLNFGLAAEAALDEGIAVESIIFGDDVAQDVYGLSSKAGRRGICGIVLVSKIVGYLSHIGENLGEIKKFATEAARSTASMGVCVSSCSKPGTGVLFRLGDDEMDLGVGVHGEAGVARLKLLSANEIVKTLLDYLTEYLKLEERSQVVALINNLGSLSCIEQWLLAGEVEKQLRKKRINVARLYAGCFFTSLDMAGVQISLLKLNEDTDKLFLEALDFQTKAPAWPNKINPNELRRKEVAVKTVPEFRKTFEKSFSLSSKAAFLLKQCLIKAAEDLIKNENHLNQLDSVSGDGDCGTTISRLAHQLLSKVSSNELNFSNPASLFFDLCLTMQGSVGGTSGALYGLFFRGVSKELEMCASCDDVRILATSWRAGINSIKKYSSARLGDKTLLDSLETACEVFEKEIERQPANVAEALKRAVNASEEGCRNTKSMRASAGRASYTDQSLQKNVDAGAYAVTVWLSAILRTLDRHAD